MRALIAAFLLLGAWPVSAKSCSIDTQAVAFGNVDVTRDSEATGRITLTCPQSATFSLSIRSNSEGSERLMSGPDGSVLRYRLYSDPNHIQPWGDGGDTGPALSSSVAAGSSIEIDIYGRIPEQNLVLPGEYADLPIVTLVY